MTNPTTEKVGHTPNDKYPECTRWAAFEHAGAITEFVEWLQREHRNMNVIAIDPTKCLYEFLEIDPRKPEQERRAMLGEYRVAVAAAIAQATGEGGE